MPPRCHYKGEVIHIRDHDARRDAEVEGGDVDAEEEGGQRGALGGPYRDRSRYVGGALEEQRALPPCEEGGDTVNHVRRYVFERRRDHSFDALTLSKPAFMSRKRVDTFRQGP